MLGVSFKGKAGNDKVELIPHKRQPFFKLQVNGTEIPILEICSTASIIVVLTNNNDHDLFIEKKGGHIVEAFFRSQSVALSS